MSTCPLGPAGKAYRSFSIKAAPLSSTSSIGQRSQLLPAQPGTGGTESTRATGKVAAELRVVKRTSMLAGLMRPAACNHRFPTHAAHTGSIISSSLTAAFHCSPTNHDLLPRGTNLYKSHHFVPSTRTTSRPCPPFLAKSREARALGILVRLYTQGSIRS